MHSTRYLYNCSPLWFIFMPYIIALYFKEDMATKNMKRLVSISKERNEYDIHYKRYKASEKARDFNRKLIKEIKNV